MPTVIIVGAGYAGVHAAATATRAGADVVLVDAEGTHDLAPRLAAVAAGRRDLGDAFAPAEDISDARIVRGRVEHVDTAGPSVRLDDGSRIDGDAVVVTVGGETVLPPIQGLTQPARTLRTASDALLLRDEILGTDALVVVGGGATGVQLAAEAAAEHPDLSVALVEAGDTLLSAFGPALGRRAAEHLRRRGVDVRTSTAVERVSGDQLHLDDGSTLRGLAVWATGVGADGSALLPDAATSDGRLLVDRELRVSGRVLAAGDVALHHDLLGRPMAPSAQVALQAGRFAGSNAARIAAGERPRPALMFELGYVVDLGGGRGVAEVGPVDLAAPVVDRLVPLLHEAIDVRHLLQAGGLRAVYRHATGRHHPDVATLRRAERPGMRSIG